MTLSGPCDPIALAVDAGRRLDALGISWVIGGSIASSVHGEARATMDIDMVIELRRATAKDFAGAFGAEYYLDGDTVREAIRTAGSFNAVHIASALKIDFFVAGNDAFEAERLARRLRVDTPAGALYVDTAEHTILRKLEWYRRGSEVSERQWRDVQAIVRNLGDRLDRSVLQRWSPRLGITDLVRRLLPSGQ